jgi:transcriptional antiterminator NusG
MIGVVDQASDDTADVVIEFKKDDVVKVIDGPFNGFSGVVEEVNEEKKKLSVIVKIFGRKTPLELGYLQVEKE